MYSFDYLSPCAILYVCKIYGTQRISERDVLYGVSSESSQACNRGETVITGCRASIIPADIDYRELAKGKITQVNLGR